MDRTTGFEDLELGTGLVELDTADSVAEGRKAEDNQADHRAGFVVDTLKSKSVKVGRIPDDNWLSYLDNADSLAVDRAVAALEILEVAVPGDSEEVRCLEVPVLLAVEIDWVFEESMELVQMAERWEFVLCMVALLLAMLEASDLSREDRSLKPG